MVFTHQRPSVSVSRIFKSSRICVHTDGHIGKHTFVVVVVFFLILALINQGKEFCPASPFVHSLPHLSKASRTFLQLGTGTPSLAASKLGCRAQWAALRTSCEGGEPG